MKTETAATDNTVIARRPNLRARLEECWLRAVRLYTFHTPLEKGRHRVYLEARKLCRYAPAPAAVRSRDGRRLWTDFSTGMHETVFFLGEYERAVTEIARALLREGDVCLDVGANFGWYTTLFRHLCGPSGSVHAFEPTPPSFAQLEINHRLMGRPANVAINRLALGDRRGEITINLFPDAPSGHASISDQGRSDAVVYRAGMTTLDAYLEEHDLNGREIDFVKVDIEGAEMLFLRGAERLFEQKNPPLVLMEMALQQARNFGYRPDDLIRYLRGRADYEFFAIDERRAKLVPIEGFAADDAGANVLCYPKGRDRLDRERWLAPR